MIAMGLRRLWLRGLVRQGLQNLAGIRMNGLRGSGHAPRQKTIEKSTTTLVRTTTNIPDSVTYLFRSELECKDPVTSARYNRFTLLNES